MPTGNKSYNQKSVDHIKEVIHTMVISDDTDHDAVLFFHVSRPRKSEQPDKNEKIVCSVLVDGCTCSIQHALIHLMESDKEMAIAIIKAVQYYQINNDPTLARLPEILSLISDHERAEKKARDNSKDASKN